MVLRRVERRDHVSSQIALLITTCSIAQNKPTKKICNEKDAQLGFVPSSKYVRGFQALKVVLSKTNRTMNRLGEWARLYEIHNFENGFLVVSRHYKINGDTQVTNHPKFPYVVAMSRQQ